MKPIEQLLQLSRNPHYTFTPEEQERLDAFLSKKAEKASKKSQKKTSKKSEKDSPVTVRNVVEKVDTYAPEIHSDASDVS